MANMPLAIELSFHPTLTPIVPPWVWRRREDSISKGKSVVSNAIIDPPNLFVSSDGDGNPVLRNLNKWPISSAAYIFKKKGSRDSKSQISGSNNYQKALSNFNRFSSVISNEKETKEKYSIEVVKKVVESLNLERRLQMFPLKELLDEEFYALFLSFSNNE